MALARLISHNLVGFLPCCRGPPAARINGMAEPKTHRVIFSLYFYLPNRAALVVQLNRQGMPERAGEGNGRPRAPKCHGSGGK